MPLSAVVIHSELSPAPTSSTPSQPPCRWGMGAAPRRTATAEVPNIADPHDQARICWVCGEEIGVSPTPNTARFVSPRLAELRQRLAVLTALSAASLAGQAEMCPGRPKPVLSQARLICRGLGYLVQIGGKKQKIGKQKQASRRSCRYIVRHSLSPCGSPIGRPRPHGCGHAHPRVGRDRQSYRL